MSLIRVNKIFSVGDYKMLKRVFKLVNGGREIKR